MAAAAADPGLLRCPKNLRECIDWVLRATGKDNGTDNDNINNLKKALVAELGSSVDSIDLNELESQLKALASGLGFLAGLPACLCKTKKSVEEGLKKIYKELKTSLISCPNSQLNCPSCSIENPCKCCVIQSIKAVKKCDCIKPGGKKCHCDGKDVSCNKVLAGLEACLHLQCLQADMNDICQCNDFEQCCKSGTCNGTSGGSGGKSCDFCQKLQSQPTTGLGLSPPNPIRLARRLEKFFGDRSSKTSKSGCTCQCNGKTPSCCCLACESTDQCVQACSCKGSGKCPCTKKPSQCPRKKFCKAIKDIKIAAESKERTCCESGKNCHCQLDPSNKCTPGSSGKCCVVSDKSGSGSNFQQGVKCMIRRLVRFFNGLPLDPSSKNCSKLCCEIFCVLKCCEFLRDFYNKGGKDKCGTCKKGTQNCNGSTLKTQSPSPSCCGGKPSACKSGNCQGCQDCDAIKFRKAFNALQYSSPCGQELYRLLDGLLNFCCYVFWPYVDKKEVKEKIEEAKKKCLSGCSQKSGGKPCQCFDCDGCKALRGHNDIMSILRHGYVSSYVNFKWNLLCSHTSQCSGCKSSCPCQSAFSFSTCSDGSCCENCDVRKAAKIFLGMLPCLYWGLKIVFDRCQYGSDFPDWYLQNISQGSIGNFLKAWGYDVRPLKSKKGSEFPPMLENLFSSGSLNSLFQTSKTYFSMNVFTPDPSKPSPSTVRSMLLWLYGLRFQRHFSDIVENCKSLCSPFGNSFHPDAFCYYIYTACFFAPLAIISLIEDSSSTATLLSSSSDWQKFSYPEDLSSLFEKLCEYARKIFVALAFLYYQCERVGSQAGWNDCAFGQRCAEKFQSSLSSPPSSVPSSSGFCSSCKHSGAYLCTAINKDPVHDHCKDGQTCRGFSGSTVSCTTHSSAPVKCTPCPHPLMRFLVATSNSNSKDYPFGLPGITPMGFKTEHLPSPGRKGEKLYHDIYGFCKDGFYPLTRLVQFILCVSRHPPETLGELFAFFVKFKDSDVFKNDFASYASGEPGTPDGSALQKAIQNLYGSHSGDHSPANLFSLSGCHAKKESGASCGPYLHALTEEVSGVFTPELCSMYLSWICYRAEKFYSEFKRFHKEAQKKFSSCCKSCQKIVECPCALPFLYSQGFTFHSPGGLNCVNAQGQEHKNNEGKEKHSGGEGDPGCTRRTCKNFIDQLKLVAEGDPFKTLIAEIEKFLWHIRKPFFLFILAFWAFVISYFLYVQLYKLDLLHLKSHAHFSRSFKILPSTLFSDASSKLKDLSYFSL